MSFNLNNLKKIVGDDKDAQASFIDLFINEMRNTEIPSIRLGLEEEKVLVLLKKAHSIKSNVKFFGYTDLADRLNSIEAELEQGNLTSEVKEKICSCLEEIEEACGSMEDWKRKNF